MLGPDHLFQSALSISLAICHEGATTRVPPFSLACRGMPKTTAGSSLSAIVWPPALVIATICSVRVLEAV